MTTVERVSAYHFSGDEPSDYFARICEQLMVAGEEAAPRGLKTKELHPTTAHIYKPRNRIVTCHGRVVNLPFALAEVIQILAGKNDAQALRHYNSQIIDIQGDVRLTALPGDPRDWVVRFNAGYGERLRHYAVVTQEVYEPYEIDQLEHIIETLRTDPDSRQANAVLWHPSADNFRRETKDRACNVEMHAMIRHGALDWMQVIRSNDAIWGIPYNLIQWCHVMEYVAVSLGVPMGKLFLVQDSFHVYEPKYAECLEVQPFSLYKYFDWEPIQMKAGEDILKVLVDTEYNIRVGVEFSGRDWRLLFDNVGIYWGSVLKALYSYGKFKGHHDDAAFDELPEYPEIRFPMLRMYCHHRWTKHVPSFKELISKAWVETVALGVSHMEANKWLGIV